MLNVDEILERYDQLINIIAKYAPQNRGGIPGNWQDDLKQELKLYILTTYTLSEHNIDDQIMLWRLTDKARQFDKLERTSGITQVPSHVAICPICDLMDSVTLERHVKKRIIKYVRKCKNCLTIWGTTSKIDDPDDPHAQLIKDPFDMLEIKQQAIEAGYKFKYDRSNRQGDNLTLTNKL